MNALTHYTPRTRPVDATTRQALRAFVAKLAGQYEIKSVILFGSRARGDYRPDSDADVMLLLSGKPGKMLPVKMALAGIAYDILLETGIRIQALPVWEEQWAHPETFSNPYLLQAIQEQGILL